MKCFAVHTDLLEALQILHSRAVRDTLSNMQQPSIRLLFKMPLQQIPDCCIVHRRSCAAAMAVPSEMQNAPEEVPGSSRRLS